MTNLLAAPAYQPEEFMKKVGHVTAELGNGTSGQFDSTQLLDLLDGLRHRHSERCGYPQPPLPRPLTLGALYGFLEDHRADTQLFEIDVYPGGDWVSINGLSFDLRQIVKLITLYHAFGQGWRLSAKIGRGTPRRLLPFGLLASFDFDVLLYWTRARFQVLEFHEFGMHWLGPFAEADATVPLPELLNEDHLVSDVTIQAGFNRSTDYRSTIDDLINEGQLSDESYLLDEEWRSRHLIKIGSGGSQNQTTIFANSHDGLQPANERVTKPGRPAKTLHVQLAFFMLLEELDWPNTSLPGITKITGSIEDAAKRHGHSVGSSTIERALKKHLRYWVDKTWQPKAWANSYGKWRSDNADTPKLD